MTDVDILALTVWAESRGEPVEGQIAVANVIKNRVALGRWGGSFEAVCRAPMQFSCWNEGTDANHQALLALANLVTSGHEPVDPRFAQARWIAAGIASGALLDNVRGATYYHVRTMNPFPRWALGQIPCASLGAHLFYRGIA